MNLLTFSFEGCPYLLPDDSDTAREIDRVEQVEARVRARIRNASLSLRDLGVLGEFVNGQRAREIFESNALEGLGPSLSRTAEILQSNTAKTVKESVHTLQDHLFVEALSSDKHLVEVLTLHGAKSLAEEFLSDWKAGKYLSEVDIRSMHSLITADEDFAGRYKRYHVRIGGVGSHEPHLPIDTPAAMREYAQWLEDSREKLPPTLRAAIAHAWLTHIHPFEDGNGRLARIIANLVLASSDLPPAIVVNASQRNTYIDALAHSDTGGDILPLTGIMLKTMKQFASYSEKPRVLRQIVREQIELKSAGMFASWRTAFESFIAALYGQLRLNNLTLKQVDKLDRESFFLLSERNTSGSTWLYRIYLDNVELLVWMGWSSDTIHSHAETTLRYPALQFAVQDERSYRLDPYRNAHADEVGGVQQVCVVPAKNPRILLLLKDGRLREGKTEDAASEIAKRIRQGFELRRSRERVSE